MPKQKVLSTKRSSGRMASKVALIHYIDNGSPYKRWEMHQQLFLGGHPIQQRKKVFAAKGVEPAHKRASAFVY